MRWLAFTLSLMMCDATLWAQSATTKSAIDIREIPADLTVPDLQSGPARAGVRVRETHPDYAKTKVYHVLYLPRNWKPGGKFPVIVEWAGNGPYRSRFGDISTGQVEGSKMGYGISGGEGYIWLCLPYLNHGRTANVTKWWGDAPEYDPRPTVDYAKLVVPWICRQYGGDTERVLLAGFSRGAIACNYIGLHDDQISGLWRAFVPYSHYDGVNEKWGYPGADRRSALRRLQRLGDRAQFICHESANSSLSLSATKKYLSETGVDGQFKFVETGFRNHNDAWILRPSPARRQLRQWVAAVLK